MFNLHRRCESLEATLRARCSDLEVELDRVREAAAARETDLFNRLMAVTNPAALAAVVAATRSSSPTQPLPAGIPIRRSPFPSSSVNRDRPLSPGTVASPILQPPTTAPNPIAASNT